MIPSGFVAGCYFDPLRADMPNVLMPHMNMRQSPMAYSPQTGYLYATACINPAWLRRDETGWAFILPAKPPGMKQYGLMAALDSRTGKLVWEKRLAYAACEGGGGATATAGGLVFHVEPDGVFQAWDARTGAIVWQFQTGEVGLPGGAGPGGGSAVVYETRRRTVRRADDESLGVGVQAAWHRAAASRAAGTAHDDRVERRRPGWRGHLTRHGSKLHHRKCGSPSGMGGRLCRDTVSRSRDAGNGCHLDEHVEDRAHDGGEGWFVDDRRDSGRRVRHGHDLQAGHVRVHLHGSPVVHRSDRGGVTDARFLWSHRTSTGGTIDFAPSPLQNPRSPPFRRTRTTSAWTSTACWMRSRADL